MNRAIIRLFAVMTLLFALLVAFTSKATVFDATALQHNKLNRLSLYQSWEVKRGRIIADDGQVLAKSTAGKAGLWNRKYPFGSLFAQAVGYSIVEFNQAAGMEQYFMPQLSGPKSALANVFGSFNGGTKVGDDVYSTLDPKGQKLAQTLMSKRIPVDGKVHPGAVVAIVPQTGAVKVLYSNPSYNDNDPARYGQAKYAYCDPPFDIGCTFNLATEGLFPPGSTFKVVTTTAALDTGKDTPDSIVNGPSPLTISGAPLQNDGNTSYHNITLTYALTNSVNTVFAPLGLSLGAKVMEKYMKRFGFYSTPPLQFPSGEMGVSGEGVYTKRGWKTILPTNPNVDLGRMSIGQDKLGVTPLQMAMVVSAVADDGKLMEPRLATKVVNNDGQVVERFPPTEYDQVMKPKVANEVQQMMRQVVEEGTGQPANLEGLTIAGKTGTATVSPPNAEPAIDDAWFIGFAPVADPKIAVAVMLEKIPDGYGGTYAAPIAAKIIQELLAEGQ
jgi:peptidoglycan glycosyltransferase